MASEETKILEIRVEYKDAIKKIADYKGKLEDLKETEKKYKQALESVRDEVIDGTKTQEDLSKAQQEYNEVVAASKVKSNEYRTAINVLEKQVTSQIKAQKSNADIMAEINDLLGTNARSIVEAEAANKALREAVRNLNDEEESAYALRQQLNAQIEDNTDFIRRNSDAYIQQKMNIGSYTESIKLAYAEIKNGGITMNTVGIIAQGFAKNLGANVARGFADATHAGTRFAGVCRLVATAFMSIPIVAAVAALAALAAAFTRTQKGMEFFQVTTAKVGAAIDVLLDRLALFGDAVIDLLNMNWDGFSKKAKDAFKGMGDEMKEEWTLAGKLKKSLIDIEKEETMLGMKRAANRAEIEKLKMVSEDVTKSTKERQEAAKKAFDMEKKLMNEEISLQERRIANQLGFTEVTDEVRKTMKDIATGAMSADEAISKLGISSSTIDDLKTFSEDVSELYDKTESSTTRQIELQNKLNSIAKEGNDKQKEMTDKELQAIREMEDALTDIIKANKEIERNKVAESYDKDIEALKGKLDKEKELTEASQKEILSLIEDAEKKKRDALEGLAFDTDAYDKQREALAKSYEEEIKLLKSRLQEEMDLTDKARNEILNIIAEKERDKAALMISVKADDEEFEKQKQIIISGYEDEIKALKKKLASEIGLTEEAQNQILEIIKAKEKEKAEAVARVSIVDADLEEERQRTTLVYDREIEDLKKRLDTEKDLTEKAREAILETIKAKEVQKENELDKLNDEAASRELERQMKLVQLKLDGVKAETEQEHNLRMQQLELQRESELASKDLTEQMKLAIVKKYEKLMNDEAVRYANETAKKQAEAIELQFETAIAKAYDNELEVARLQMEQKKASLDAIQQMEGESLEAFNLRKIQAENEYLDAKKDVAAKEIEIEQGKLQAMSDITGGLISLVEAIGESDKAAAVASKVLALAQIAIETGKAISKMVSAEAGKGIAGIATMATGIATILANIATAIKTVKSAKFATGGDVTGAGTATSDSIPAMLSNGESVLTAKATNMFAPILSAFNQAGGGVPIHGQQTGNQAMGEDMLARAFAKGVAGMPNPIVSVEEITNVTKRVQVIENINRI